MRIKRYITRKKIAVFLLVVFISNIISPGVALALTSGPTAPEVQGFQQAGTSDMVDLSTGDFKYNIPLLDIDGYPINLSYQSGVGIEDEASWVGLGWSLNVGSINRQLRGLPDDMKGDQVETDQYTKPKVTVGASLSGKVEIGGYNTLVKGEGTLTLGVFNDNYTGIGAEIGVNPGISLGRSNDGFMTAGLGMGIMSNTQSGVTLTPYANLSIKNKSDINTTESAGLSASLGYNSRSGIKSLTLGTSFNVTTQQIDAKSIGVAYGGGTASVNFDMNSGTTGFSTGSSTISYNTEPITPKVAFPYKTTFGTFSIDIGLAGGLTFTGGGGSGYKTVQEVQSRNQSYPAYGFLYADQGKDIPNAEMDFIREKDNPVIPELPNLAVPIPTPDLFTYTSQTGSGQFRLYRGGTGILFDNQAQDVSSTSSVGFDAGFGSYFHGGVTLFNQSATNTTRKWTANNDYKGFGDFQSSTPQSETVYFKQIGEKTAADADMDSQLLGTTPAAVNLYRKTNSTDVYAGAQLNNTLLAAPITKHIRQPRTTSISYLTATEAQYAGLDRDIKNYQVNDAANFTPTLNTSTSYTPIKRVSNYRLGHHFSEITVTDPTGKRMIYGVPVYNVSQSEYTFAVGALNTDYTLASPNQVKFSASSDANLGKNKGIDNYYHKDTQPPYATSFLLSGIVSPDYVDKTGDGISDDDLGTAIKFNYSMVVDPVSKNPVYYKWRSPYKNATLNRGLLADFQDDKASIVCGQREQWYVSSIESKTKIVYFITSPRQDAMGADFSGNMDSGNPQRYLSQIRIYSKADLSKPIKTVMFQYDYSLCPNTPNSTASGGGKLTLTKVWFQYGNTTKGANFPYQFSYNTTYTSPSGAINANVGYTPMSTDRWGVYKVATDNSNFNQLTNEEFPYTTQDLVMDPVNHPNTGLTTSEGQAASLWHLNKINLPTGGEIDVSYESDDYAYVQDKKAMVMTTISSMIDQNNAVVTDLSKAYGIKIPIGPTADTKDATPWFKENYLNGSDYIYTKLSVQESTNNSASPGGPYYDFIPCYCKVSSVMISGNYAYVQFEQRTDGGVSNNPIIFAAWQRMKDEYPRYAYPGFDTRAGNETAAQSVVSAVQAIFNAAKNLSEFKESFYSKASREGYCTSIQQPRSFARIVKSDGHKLGGGVRVSKIMINDNWNNINGGSQYSVYGQAYSYTTVDNGQTISSGVASYEPSVGGDENPLRQPIFYVEKIRGAPDGFFDLEEPFGESLFPAPGVIYSRVTVTDLVPDPSNNQNQIPDPNLQTGYTVNEFYTAKDFPVRVSVTPMQPFRNNPKGKYSLTETSSIDEQFMSQGYSVELNDMAGKQKAIHTYDQSQSEIASTVYNYNTAPDANGQPQLSNSVSVVNQDGTVSNNQTVGREIEFFTDFREQESINNGQTINLGADIIPAFGIPLPIPHWPTGGNSEYKLFRSAAGIKIIQDYGILSSITKMVNGSTNTTQYLAFDALTGKPVVTATQNEFNRNIYSVDIPAYWAYQGMGPAYQSQGTIFTGLTTSSTGLLGNYSSYLKPGDEILDLSSNLHYWIIKEMIDNTTGKPVYTPGALGYDNNTTPAGYSESEYVIDQYGRLVTNLSSNLKVVRSGNRNMQDMPLTSIVYLTNPIIPNSTNTGYRLAIDNTDLTSYKIINASSQTYDERWSSGVPSLHATQQNAAYDWSISGGIITAGYDNGSYIMNNTYTDHTFTDADHSGAISLSGSTYWEGAERLYYSDIINSSSALITQGSNNILDIYGTFYALPNTTYYIGFNSSLCMSFKFDCSAHWISLSSHDDQGKFGWYIIPVTFTPTASNMHTIDIQLTYANAPSPLNWYGAGVEIYNNTLQQLQSTDNNGTGINTIWSSAQMRNSNTTPELLTAGSTTVSRFSYNDGPGTNYIPCAIPDTAINPYLSGFLGNWHPYKTKVLMQNRGYNNVLTPSNSAVDVKNAGYITNFYSDWIPPAAGYTFWSENLTNGSWVTANTVTMYDKYGQQLENKDAIPRFSAAKFDFNGEFPGAVASNARNREIYANSLEDGSFVPGEWTYFDPPVTAEFIEPSTGKIISTLATSGYAHSGNSSVLVPSDGFMMTTKTYTESQRDYPYLNFNAANQFIKNPALGIYPNGFEPSPGNYIFDVWVHDGVPNRQVNLNLSVNGTAATLTCKAIVEDWKLLEGTINFPGIRDGNALTLAITPVSGTTVYIDDIRIHPFNSEMKSYVYDASTLRLMAELDENAFATFYEYDSEGQLIRVKKETERGIMSLKEARSSQRKGQ